MEGLRDLSLPESFLMYQDIFDADRSQAGD
jgi:hypothetical protein